MANIEDLIKTGGCIEEDEWSLTRPRFGIGEHLEVVGYFRDQTTRRKYYIVKCNECAKDPELYGAAFFKVQKGNLNSGKIPCGCNPGYKRTEKQWEIICTRQATSKGYKFSGFVPPWSGNKTRVRLVCEIHGEWSSGAISDFMLGCGCPSCVGKNQKIAYINLVRDEKGECRAIKFGITNKDPTLRASQQSSKSVFNIINYMRYDFESRESCRSAEQECLREITCGVIEKEAMLDGWSETVDVKDLDKIISIYEKHGGKRIK